jgi:hypothetical protein
MRDRIAAVGDRNRRDSDEVRLLLGDIQIMLSDIGVGITAGGFAFIPFKIQVPDPR